jgi:hypothetical protein
MPKNTPNTIDDVMARVRQDGRSGCWEWTGARNDLGYGYVQFGGRNRRVHRVVYEHFVGAIGNGLVIDHLCRNRGCCNPSHLRAVTQAENMHAPGSLCVNVEKVAQTHCVHGHLFDDENTIIKSNGCRDCRRCGRDRTARYKARKRLDVA